ncbi:MAG: hypothetical protein GX171_08565 [Clostridiales bacterium]|nr:hypothetical protein [Clostridiales bacterium]
MAKNVENVENTEYQEPITKEEMQDEIAINESAILRALTDQSQHDDRVETIEVLFGKTRFRFRIRPLSEKEWDKCRERNTKYQKNRRLGGMRLPESTNTTGYHSDLIYTATVDEDKAKLWDNQKFWSAVNAVTGTDMVDKLIPYAGKKQQVVERIEMLSGYGDESEADYEEAVKN